MPRNPEAFLLYNYQYNLNQMSQSTNTNTNIRRVKEVSSALKETYRNYFLRGTQKFISKYSFKPEDLDKDYTLPDGDFKLIGQINEKILLMEKEGSSYYVDASYFHKERKRE